MASVSRISLFISVFVVPGGIVVIDPGAGLLFLVLGGILGSVAAFLSSEGTRVVALIVLAVAVLFALLRFPEARRHIQSVRERAQQESTKDQY